MATIIWNCFIVLTILSMLIVSGQSDDTLTPEEKAAVKKFYPRVKDILTQDIQHDDKYLIRWIRARNFNLDEAEAMLQRNMVWRKKEQIDGIRSEDFHEFEKRSPFNFDTVDRDGRPTEVSGIGQMDVRRIVLGGKAEELDRYLIYGIERGMYNIYGVSNRTGKFFVDGHLIFDMNGFSLRTHACAICIPSWIRLVNNYERYYPQLATALIIINTPRVFEVVLTVLRPLMSPHTAKVLRIFGLDKELYRKELLAIFPEDELPIAFGGTRKTRHL